MAQLNFLSIKLFPVGFGPFSLINLTVDTFMKKHEFVYLCILLVNSAPTVSVNMVLRNGAAPRAEKMVKTGEVPQSGVFNG